jgi:protein O-mannosyl-transferase
VKWAFTTTYASNWHPLTWISHMLDYQVFGTWAGGHHIVSLGFHLANTVLLFWFLLYTTRRAWASLFVAGLFALHPLHVESVAWVAERKDVLSTFFWLGTMLAYAFYAARPSKGRYAGVVTLFVLGLMSKPMLVTLPLVLLLLDYWPLGRFEMDRGVVAAVRTDRLRQLVVEKVPLLVLAVASAIVTIVAQRTAIAAFDAVDLSSRLSNAAISYCRYAWLMIWPAKLATFYPYGTIHVFPDAAITTAALIAATIAAVWFGRRQKYLLVGWLWYVITLVPVIGILQVGLQSHADRYTYVPLMGLFVAITWWVADIVETRRSLKVPAAIAATCVLAAAACMSWVTVGYWKDTISLASRAVSVTKNNHTMLGILAAAQIDHGQFDEAVANLEEAIKCAPSNPDTLAAMGYVMLKKGKLQEAVNYCQAAIAIKPSNKETWLNGGLALYALGRAKEAEHYLRKAVETDPYWAEAYSQLARVLGETGRVDEAITTYKKALELKPELGEAHFNIGVLYMHKGRFDVAAEELTRSIAIEPDAEAWNDLAGCMVAMKKLTEAEHAYAESLKLAPDAPQTHRNLAAVLASQGRKAEALNEARRAVALDPNNAEFREYSRRLASEHN